ncbi:hypothetical protein [Pseudanabaena yagii]|uniref:Transmembrane protein n=1 Tax=Pseudanabaena yagii GIHE-NHR1 TaxID=2722753 RepID=A0ABX1LXF1_9CYAN|nr:hypothetical protein [Pseudanabaena yagii]NMF59439.1 hypothetical protein [Pseudanabaena yagii GIHE-NHR1]
MRSLFDVREKAIGFVGGEGSDHCLMWRFRRSGWWVMRVRSLFDLREKAIGFYGWLGVIAICCLGNRRSFFVLRSNRCLMWRIGDQVCEW